jgi:hypothetical protein
MKTLLGTEIPQEVKGLVYLCDFDYTQNKLTVFKELLCDSGSLALEMYANIPNAPSQIAYGKTHEEFCKELEILHISMADETWLKDLANCL